MAQKLSQTYKEAGEQFIAEPVVFPENVPASPETQMAYMFGIRKFAEYLDQFKVLTPDLQIMAMTKAREIDGEVLKEIEKIVGREPMVKAAEIVLKRHRHTKNPIESVDRQ